MKRIITFICIFLMLPSAMQGMVRRPVIKPGASHTLQPKPRVPKRTIVDVRHLKHVHNVIKPEYAHYSPLIGANLINSDFLKQVYQFGPTHPTTRLLNDPKLGLFNLQNTQFRDTQSLSMPGKSLTPELIGQILGHLQTGNLETPEVQQELIKKWKKHLNNTFKTSISLEKVTQFLKLLQESKKAENDPEDKRLFLPNITEAVMTGFLYRKVTQKRELFDYMNELNKQVPILKTNLNQYLKDNYISNALKSKYEALKLKNFTHEHVQRQLEYIKNDFEGVSCALMHQNNANAVPPQVMQSSYGYQGQCAVPNCTETALQDLCNILLADVQTGSFNLKLLPAHVKPIQPFKDFYMQYPEYGAVNNHQVGQAWMDLVSNHNSIIYVAQKNYEVECSSENILKLMNRLLNIQAKSWQEFGNLLSDEHRTISCKEKTIKDTKRITFSLGNKEFDLVIETDRHTYLDFPHRTDEGELYMDRLSEWLTNDYNYSDNRTYVTGLIPLLKPAFPSSYYYYSKSPLAVKSLYWFSLDLDHPNNIIYLLSHITDRANENPTLRDMVIKDMVIKLVKKLPQDDHHFKTEAFKAIVRSKAYKESEELLRFIKTYPHAARQHDVDELFDCCLENTEVGAELITLLLERGATPTGNSLSTALNHGADSKMVQMLIQANCPLKGNELARAISMEHCDAAQIILDYIGIKKLKNLDADYAKYANQTPLEHAMNKWHFGTKNSSLKKEWVELIRSLAQANANINFNIDKASSTNWTFMTYIFMKHKDLEGAIELTKIFCQYGGNVNAMDKEGNNVLGAAIERLRYSFDDKKEYYYRIIEILVDTGAHIASIKGNTRNALDLADEMKDKKLKELIWASKRKQEVWQAITESKAQNNAKKWYQKVSDYFK